MMKAGVRWGRHWLRQNCTLATLALGILAAPALGLAQSAVIYGSLGNFDISNDTDQVCHGFEVELEGVTVAQVPYAFSAQRYGAPQVIPSAAGVRVRWASPYDASARRFVERTLPHTVPWFPGQCYQWNPATYQDSGCEHFGTGVTANPSRVTARWLCEDPARPGVLVPHDPPTAIPMPSYYVQPPVQPNNPPVLVVEVEAPEPAEAPELYGEAQWMRVFKVELERALTLEELVADNPAVVPMDLAQLESDYQILQDEPAAGGHGNRRRKRHQGNIAPTTRAVVRRIELYRFTGQYDPVTNEALCADLLCDVPAADEIGELISVQMSAANVQPDAVVVTRTGNGNVASSDKLIACGNRCAQPYNAGSLVTLTAKAGSGSTFLGWSDGCHGTQLTCTVTANGVVTVTAAFSVRSSGGGGGGGGGQNPTLSVKTVGGKGSILSVPAGINCGKTCAVNVPRGSSWTLSATPEPGFRFVGWSGGCVSAEPTCTVHVNSGMTVQANFTK
ncbi:MAG: hypothetical protein AB7N91_07015 [Candidatus Tectimicrobiota bacterium]